MNMNVHVHVHVHAHVHVRQVRCSLDVAIGSFLANDLIVTERRNQVETIPAHGGSMDGAVRPALSEPDRPRECPATSVRVAQAALLCCAQTHTDGQIVVQTRPARPGPGRGLRIQASRCPQGETPFTVNDCQLTFLFLAVSIGEVTCSPLCQSSSFMWACAKPPAPTVSFVSQTGA